MRTDTSDEMSPTVTALALNAANGELTIEQSIPMLPERGRWAEPLHAPDFAAAGSSEELLASLEALQAERESIELQLLRGDGDVVEAILRHAEDADLVVMATRGREGVLDALRGSVTSRVVGAAPCPVLAVPSR